MQKSLPEVRQIQRHRFSLYSKEGKHTHFPMAKGTGENQWARPVAKVTTMNAHSKNVSPCNGVTRENVICKLFGAPNTAFVLISPILISFRIVVD
ncbi:hypothetical protein KIN20_030416 [Parelaphostrongylus tenuis]|uniref:Uncharacterized protein n=1 Tax=Parelaphostrongylus tenuis TaxID=148309 RepID=A0AAD5WGA6_PARTN|nr:hypothetical protein KIN20_030416 [Parelaphostrongylus tenuis]